MATETLQAQLQQLMQQQTNTHTNTGDELLQDFVTAYFGPTREEQLGNRSALELLAVAQSHFRLAAQRQRGAVAVAVDTLEQSQHGCDMAVMTVAPDMAFIVDTVLMAVRDADAEIDWVMHPILRLVRDDAGALTAVEGSAGQQDHDNEESLVYVEFRAPATFDRELLIKHIKESLADLRMVVDDYQPMRDQLWAAIDQLDDAPASVDADECAEAQAFLRWLDGNHFTLLGYRRRAVAEGAIGGEEAMIDVPGSSLGLLREDRPGIDPDGYVAPAAELDKYAQSPRILVVAKANTRAWIHHPEPMDVVAIKRLDGNGNIIGAHRFLGLFSADAYAQSPRNIPGLDNKVQQITARAGFKPGSHDAKSLLYILETFPRDELFQSGEDELFNTVLSILAMRESEPLRLFLRRDRYGRFYSCLVYLPRDRHTPDMRWTIARVLEHELDGNAGDSHAAFLRNGRVRLYYQINTTPGSQPIDAAAVEQALLTATRSWADTFTQTAAGQQRRVSAYAHAFPVGYTERNDAATAVDDARILASLHADSPPVLTLRRDAQDERALLLKVFGVGAEASLSDVLPILENFGLAVQTQRPFPIHAPDGSQQWIHEFVARHPMAQALENAEHADALATAFTQVRTGTAENDRLNQLIIAAGLTPRQVVLVRTITRYLLQTGLPFSAEYLESLLAEHGAIVAEMLTLFALRFDPDNERDEQQRLYTVQNIEAHFDDITSLDADRALRTFYGVITAMLRTNFYQLDAAGEPKPHVSIKLDPTQVPELPLPLPAYESFVYAPQVEGIHLRGGLVARGGLRWSDRQEDFRTEVLGLLKAQMVKNAVIVPVGAKGGFVVKNAPAVEDREARQARGVACYQTFIRGLLDITDNRDADGIVHPERVVRHDGDDPYLVVAADKGTATFSDIANELAQEYDYWLDDAFASGGSAGYDHKGMGITARGAWESVKRHFRELGQDTQSEPFTVIGIGDMAGDVFGNGMLRSQQIRLIAAFNHMHIFIDPDPDPAVTYQERERLFNLGRSAWSDYDTSLISQGGDIYERSAKLIELSDEAMQTLDIRSRRLTPDELIHEILKAPVDLLWNGGIGTYVKARHEPHAAVGDRANENVRVNGQDLRCRVVGEGGNLGMTQAGRIEYALNGGRLNTDAIDNSGGVDSSDLEVNIKIALGTVEAAGQLQREQRNTLLQDMTEDVVSLVLRTNYLQPQQLSLLAEDSPARFDEQVNFMRTLEQAGLVDRAVENLPDEETIAERQRNRRGLTRPELAILLSHAKVALANAALDSDLPDDSYLETMLLESFPAQMRQDHADAIRNHRLKRELVATLVTNQMVNRTGIAMAHRMATDHGVDLTDSIRAYVLADAWLDAEALYRDIEALDNVVGTDVQYRQLRRINALVKHAMNWQLATSRETDATLGQQVARHGTTTRRLLDELPEYISGAYAENWQTNRDNVIENGLQEPLATRMASITVAGGLLDIVSVANSRDADLEYVARLYFELGDTLGLAWLHMAIQALNVDGRWPALARSSLRGDCYRIHQGLVELVLDAGGDLAAWQQSHAGEISLVRNRIDDLQAIDHPTFAHLTVAVRDLSRLYETLNGWH